MKLLPIFLLLMLHCMASCAQDVVVLPANIPEPEGAQKKGTITIGNNTTQTQCDYEGLVEKLKDKARELHGNVVKITQLIDPNFIGKCYKVKADIYLAGDIGSYKKMIAGPTSDTASRNYATLYLYRLRDTLALITCYNVHLNKDSVIYRAHKRSADTVRLYKEGPVTLWADIEIRRELKFDVKFGGEYYVRCGLIKGEIRMTPVLELVDKPLGAKEFNSLHRNKNEPDVKYLRYVH